MQELAREIAINRAGGRRAVRLREVHHDEPAASELDAGVALELRIADLQRVVRADQRAILEHGIRRGGHGLVVRADVHGAGIAPHIQAHEVAAPEKNRFVRSPDMRHHARTGEAPEPHAILHDGREGDAFLARHVPAHATFRASAIETAESPAIPARRRVRRIAPPRPPPIHALEPSLRFGIAVGQDHESWIARASLRVRAHDSEGRAGVNHHPALRTGAETAVPIAFDHVVRSRSPFVLRVEIRLRVGVGADDDVMSAQVVWNGVERGLDGLERRAPTAAVGVVTELGDVQGQALASGGRGFREPLGRTQNER